MKKRIFTSAFITLILALSVAGAAPATHAAQGDECNTVDQSCALDGGGTGYCKQIDTGWSCSGSVRDPNLVPPDPSAAQKPTDFKGPDLQFSYNGIMGFIASLFAWLLGVAAITLDNAVYYTVVTMGTYVHNLQAVGIAWRVLRDIGNIILIFGFLAIGISTILNSEWYGGGKKMLPMLIVAAVFLNFSLFISEAVIDVGNLFATQFYTQINNGQPAKPINFDSRAISQEGISNKIMEQMGLVTIYGKFVTEPGTAADMFQNSAMIGFLSILLFLVAAFVFFTLAFVLIARFVALLFLIIIAPIGFAGLAIPQLKGTANKWWSALFQQTITAPILLLLLYIALLVITDAQFLKFGTAPSWTGFVTGNAASNITGFGNMLLSFLVAMGLLLAVVIISKKLEAFGAGWAAKMGGAVSFGAVSLGGRATLGLAGNLMVGTRALALANRLSQGGRLAKTASLGMRGLNLGGKLLQNRTFDARNSPLSAGLGALGINAGTGTKFTMKQVGDQVVGFNGDWRDKSNYNPFTQIKPVRDFMAHSQEERAAADRQVNAWEAKIEADRLQREYDADKTVLTPAQQAARDKKLEDDLAVQSKIIAADLAKKSIKEIEELQGIKDGVQSLVENLSPAKFEALLASDKLTSVEKDKIKKARYAKLNKSLEDVDAIDETTNPVEHQEAVKKVKTMLAGMSKGEIESLPDTTRNNPVVLNNLSAQQRDALMKSEKLGRGDKEEIKKSRYAPLETAVNSAAPADVKAQAIKKALGSLSKEEIETLPPELLSNKDVLAELSPQQYENLIKSDKLTSGEIGQIKTARYANLDTAAAGGNVGAIKKALNALSNGELESMPSAMLANPAIHMNLSDKQRDTITGGKERTTAEKELVRKTSKVGIVEGVIEAAGGYADIPRAAAAVAAHPSFADLDISQIVKLDKRILTQPVIAEKLTTPTLIELQKQNMKPADMSAIGDAIRRSATANAKTKDYVSAGPGSLIWG